MHRAHSEIQQASEVVFVTQQHPLTGSIHLYSFYLPLVQHLVLTSDEQEETIHKHLEWLIKIHGPVCGPLPKNASEL